MSISIQLHTVCWRQPSYLFGFSMFLAMTRPQSYEICNHSRVEHLDAKAC